MLFVRSISQILRSLNTAVEQGWWWRATLTYFVSTAPFCMLLLLLHYYDFRTTRFSYENQNNNLKKKNRIYAINKYNIIHPYGHIHMSTDFRLIWYITHETDSFRIAMVIIILLVHICLKFHISEPGQMTIYRIAFVLYLLNVYYIFMYVIFTVRTYKKKWVYIFRWIKI